MGGKYLQKKTTGQRNIATEERTEYYFAITPHTVPTKDILTSVEAAICHLPYNYLYRALKHQNNET